MPEHWGEPPKVGTLDLRELLGGYGLGFYNWSKLDLAIFGSRCYRIGKRINLNRIEN